MRLLDDIIGKEILDNEANILGNVKDIEIDSASNRIESIIYIRKGSNKKLGKTTEEKIPFEDIGSIGDKIIIHNKMDKIRELLDM